MFHVDTEWWERTFLEMRNGWNVYFTEIRGLVLDYTGVYRLLKKIVEEVVIKGSTLTTVTDSVLKLLVWVM